MPRLFSVWYAKIIRILSLRPIASFFALLVILFGIIVLGFSLRAPQAPAPAPAPEKKATRIFDTATDTPRLAVPAEVKKESVIEIVALAPAVVSRILTTPGRTVASGQTLLELTNDYRSGTASLQKEIAINDHVLAEKIDDLDKKIFRLESKQVRTRNSRGEITDREENIELTRLKQDRAAIKNDAENKSLSRKIAERNDAVLKPKVFAAGTVQNVLVRTGDFVATGDVLATIRATHGSSSLEVLVSRKTAALFDPTKPSRLLVDGERIKLTPTYFSEQETEDGLYAILFSLSESTEKRITDGEFLTVELPLRAAAETLALLPIDAVFQDERKAWVLVEEEGKAASKEVTLGNVYGSFAEVTSGLAPDARVILNRSVIAGDEIIIIQ